MIETVATTELNPAPIPRDWILSGTPEARNKELARSHDGTFYVVVWECTEGHFNWHYVKDEELVVLSGEVFITDEQGERRLGAGDVGFFPAGTSCKWRVTQRVRKVAVLRETMPLPLGFGLRAVKALLRRAGLGGQSPF
jgi:hypothetical protein